MTNDMRISPVDDCAWMNEDATLLIDGDTPELALTAAMIINNHDQLTKENEELREALLNLIESAEVNEKQLNDMLMCGDYGESEALCKARNLLKGDSQ